MALEYFQERFQKEGPNSRGASYVVSAGLGEVGDNAGSMQRSFRGIREKRVEAWVGGCPEAPYTVARYPPNSGAPC